MLNDPPLRTYAAYLRERHGERVHRIALDAGFGCPHRRGGRGAGGCVYCSPSGSGTAAFDRGISIREQMRRGMERLSRRGVKGFIAYFQAFCGTSAGPGELVRRYREGVDFPGVKGLSVGARPDQVPGEALEAIQEAGSDLDTWLELGLQSAHDETLEGINRGHDVACFDEALHRADLAGIQVAAHVILGLPGETKEKMMATARHVAASPVKAVKLHHLYVENGTELADRYAKGEFTPLSLEAYLELAVEFIRRLKPDCILMRLAGKGSRDGLIAPKWDGPPGTLAQRLISEMQSRKVRQGDLFDR